MACPIPGYAFAVPRFKFRVPRLKTENPEDETRNACVYLSSVSRTLLSSSTIV
jgi:hypothetical protein